MILINDEILNKFLDGELSKEDSEHVISALKTSPDLQKKLNALKIVHEKLSLMSEDILGAGFTAALMKKITARRLKVPKQQKYFIASIVTVIVLLCLIIFGYSLSTIISAIPSSASDSQPVFDSISTASEGIVNIFKQIFNGRGLSIIGSVFSIVVIISGYYFIEMQKRSKANTGN